MPAEHITTRECDCGTSCRNCQEMDYCGCRRCNYYAGFRATVNEEPSPVIARLETTGRNLLNDIGTYWKGD